MLYSQKSFLFQSYSLHWPPPGRGGGGKLALIFSGYVPLASHTPYPIIVRWPIIDPILVTFGQIFNFRQLSHFLFSRIDPFFRLNEEHFTFHLQYKHSATFANRKYAYEELS